MVPKLSDFKYLVKFKFSVLVFYVVIVVRDIFCVCILESNFESLSWSWVNLITNL